MSKDIMLVYNEDNLDFDIQLNNGDLLREQGLQTAVMISLFTDRRAADDDLLRNDDEYRGWWGDNLETNDQIGSKLWLLDNKATQESISLAKQYIKDSLQWMIDDGVVTKIDVDVEKIGDVGNYVFGADIKLYYRNNLQVALKFKNLWEAQLDYAV